MTKMNMKIKIGDTWKTYVLVRGDTWFNMNVDYEKIEELAKKDLDGGFHIEAWIYHRGENGDELKSKQKLGCEVCKSYDRPGMIYNANQWVCCFRCNQTIAPHYN